MVLQEVGPRGFAEAALLASQAQWSAEHRHSEADLRSDLSRVLLPFALETLGLPPDTVRQEGSGHAGRFDTMLGAAIIEYKAPRRLRLRHEQEAAARQALGYLEDEQLGARVVVVTDGETWGILRDMSPGAVPGEQISLDLGPLTQEPLPPVSRFAWRSTSEATAQAVLDLIAGQQAAPVTSTAVVGALGLGRQEALALVRHLAGTLAEREPGGRTATLFAQWIGTAGISYGIADETAPWPRRSPPSRVLPPSLGAELGHRSFAEAVYCLHTYVAFAAKVVAAEVLALQRQRFELRPSQWAGLEEHQLIEMVLSLERGTLSEQLGAPGLLASDLFDWYAHELASHPLLVSALREVLRQLGGLAWAEVANAGGLRIDVLRELYQSVLPRDLRKALGEFFTPRWLAERVLARGLELLEVEGRASGDGPVPRTLDPTCGSGTFLVAVMRTGLERLDQQERGHVPEALEDLIERVVGIDINPVSALMSRVNLLLALGDRAQLLPEVTFQVFQADSIVLPRVRAGQMRMGAGGDFLGVPTAVGELEVAGQFLRPDRMAILRRNLEAAVRGRLGEEEFLRLLLSELSASLNGEPLEEDVVIRTSASLYQRLVALRDEGRNDVWARVLEQFMAPYLLGEVELVIGNPPWISWKALPAAWKGRSEPLWRAWGLWRSRQRGGGLPLSDISTLLLARAIVTYAPRGLVALLLPESALRATPSGDAFRRCHLRPEPEDRTNTDADADIRFRPLWADDFVAVNPFSPDATNRTVALYVLPGAPPTFPIGGSRWRRRSRSSIRSEWGWPRALTVLEGHDIAVAPVEDKRIESPWGLAAQAGALPLMPAQEAVYRLGRGYETRGLDGLFTYQIVTMRPDSRGLVRVRNDPDAGRNTRGDDPREGVVESQLLWPLAKGEDVERWRVGRAERYWLVPYLLEADAPRVVTAEECQERFPRLYRYLVPWLPRFRARSLYRAAGGGGEAPWILSGPLQHLRATGFLVLVRYIATDARPAAAVATPYLDPRLGRTTLPIPNNKSNIYYATTPGEAYFLAGFVNSSPAQKALSRFAVSTGVTPDAIARLPIPEYDARDSDHEALAVASEAAHRATAEGDADKVARLEAEIDSLVLRVAR